MLLAQGLPGQALALLDRLYAAAVTQDRIGSVIEAGALRVLALAASGEESRAAAALADALTLACPRGYVRIFVDEGKPMAALLGRLITAQRAGQAAAEVPLGCLARLKRAFDSGPTMPGPGRLTTGVVPGLVEALTDRELEVLGMLAAGRSNQAVAGELVVTIDTVKKHVSHVLDKLGRYGQPHRSRRPGTRAGPDPLAAPRPISRSARADLGQALLAVLRTVAGLGDIGAAAVDRFMDRRAR